MADSLKSDLQKLNDKFGQLFTDGDCKGVSELYTEDCRVMPTGSDVIIGRPGIQKLFESVRQSGLVKMKLTTIEVVPEGDDHVTERGSYVFFDKEGAEADVGKFMVLWRKENGQWKLHFDMFNSNKG